MYFYLKNTLKPFCLGKLKKKKINKLITSQNPSPFGSRNGILRTSKKLTFRCIWEALLQNEVLVNGSIFCSVPFID